MSLSIPRSFRLSIYASRKGGNENEKITTSLLHLPCIFGRLYR